MSGPRTILYMADIPELGGGEVNLLALAGGLEPGRYRPSLIAPGEGPFAAAARRVGIEPVMAELPPPRLHLGVLPWLSPAGVFAVVRAARASRAALLHANSYFTAAYGAAAGALLGLPCMWTCRGWGFRSHGMHAAFLDRGLAEIVAISEWCRDKLLAPGAVRAHRVPVIPQGVDLGRFRPGPADLGARQALGLDPGLPVVGIVGTLYPLKGHARLFEAVARLAAAGTRLQVLVVGAGWPAGSAEEAAIRAVPARLGIASSVVFLGARRDTDALYRAMDMLAAPSEVESFGTAIVEAQASGLPVVATRVGAPAETVRDGVTGWLEDPFAVDRWVARLGELARDPGARATMGRAAAAWARERFDLGRTRLAYQAVYDRLLGQE